MTPWPPDLVEVARVQGAWGVRGWLRLVPHSVEPTALLAARSWYFCHSDLTQGGGHSSRGLALHGKRGDSSRESRGVWSIRHCRRHSGSVVADIEGIGDRTVAESFVGAFVYVRKADFPRLDDEEYYLVDLIGMHVQNREGVQLGHVSHLLPTGPQWVLVLDGERVRMVPFVKAYVDSVDIAGRCIVVDWHPDD